MITFNQLIGNYFTRHRWLSIWLLLALLGYTFFSVVADNIAKKFIDLLLLGSVIAFFLAPKVIRRDGSVYIFIVSIIAALLSWALMLYQHPDIAESSPQVHKLTYWMFLLPIAIALGGDVRKVIGVWLLAAVALLLAPWFLGIGSEAVKQGLAGYRTDLNLLNAQHGAMYFAVILLGLGAVLPNLLHLTQRRTAALGIWLLLTSYVILAIVMTQTRAVWLGVLVALCAQAAFRLYRVRILSRRVAVFMLLALAFLIGLLVSKWDLIEDRVLQSQAAIESLVQGEPIPFDSAGARLNLWQEAMPWVSERPLTGWGVSGKKLVIQQAERFPDWVKHDLSHMHNSFLDALVNFGVIGLASVVALWVFMVNATFRLWRKGEVADDLFIFYVSFLLLWFVINCFESYMQFASGRFVFALVSGGMLSLIWHSKLQAAKRV